MADIYDYQFNKLLNKEISSDSNEIIYDTFNSTDPANIASGGVIVGSGIQVGKIQTSSALSPFDVATDGTGNIRRVGAIKIVSANDLGISTLTPAPTANKVIYSDNTNDLRINAPTNSAIVSLDVNSAQIYINGVQKSGLTNSSANSIFDIALNSGDYVGGTITWSVVATDGTDYQCRAGITTFAAVKDNSATLTSDVDEVISSIAVTSGTLTGTWSIATGTNKITLKFTPTSSLTPTTYRLNLNLHNPVGNTITRL